MFELLLLKGVRAALFLRLVLINGKADDEGIAVGVQKELDLQLLVVFLPLSAAFLHQLAHLTHLAQVLLSPILHPKAGKTQTDDGSQNGHHRYYS
jgi:hypothetical protein